MLKLIVTEKNGYCEHFENVEELEIKKINNKNHLIFKYINKYGGLFNSYGEAKLLLKDIESAFLIETDTMIEYFRYTK